MDVVSSSFNLLDIYSLKCSANAYSACMDQCESCQLIKITNRTKPWFVALGYTQKRVFLEELLDSAPVLMQKLPSILYSLHGKDYHYTKSNLKASSTYIDDFQNDSNHSIARNMMDACRVEFLNWFNSSSNWARSNYVLILLQMCNAQLLDSIKEFASEKTNSSSALYLNIDVTGSSRVPTELDDNLPRVDDGISDENTRPNFSGIVKCKSAHDLPRRTVPADAKKRAASARERVFFEDKIDIIEEMPSRNSRVVKSAMTVNSKHTASSLGRYSRLSARCTPVTHTLIRRDLDYSQAGSIRPGSVSPDSMSMYNAKKDFIKCLPIHLAKKILGYLDEQCLDIVARVSTVWEELGRQVKAETKYIQARNEDVMLMQSTGARTPHPCYARKVPVYVPKLNSDGSIRLNTEANHVDVELLFNEFADINMETFYDGHNIETKAITMDERNVYCSSYNVLMLEARQDASRHIHYNGGKFLSFGASDRKVHVINVDTGDKVKTIHGHTASVKCLCLDEKNKLVISGSYDTTIRLWDLVSGKCKVIFLGHQGTIACLTVSKQTLISSANDCTVKTWGLSSGKCTGTINHSCIVKTLRTQRNHVFGGTADGELICWDIKTLAVMKTYQGHKDSLTCLWSNAYFVFSGSMDGVVKLWNNLGNFGWNHPLKIFRHPAEVHCLDVSYCRLITGCSDGKIRIWNALNGCCLRVIRGNSKNDPIMYLSASSPDTTQNSTPASPDRLVVNTVSSILVYNFEPVQWNYSAPREQGETVSKKASSFHNSTDRPHAYTRAQKLLYFGSPLHKNPTLPSGEEDFKEDVVESGKSGSTPPIKEEIGKISRSRIKSAPPSRRVDSVDQHVQRIKSATVRNRTGGSIKSINPQEKPIRRNASAVSINTQNIYLSSNKPKVRIRCRSAPVQKVVTLPPGERGVSTSAFSIPANSRSQMVLKVPSPHKEAGISRPKTAHPCTPAPLKDMKLRTFHSQLHFEEKSKLKAIFGQNVLIKIV